AHGSGRRCQWAAETRPRPYRPAHQGPAMVLAVQRRGREQTPPQELVAEPLNSELVVFYAENRPGALRILSSRDDVGDRTRLREASLANLSRLLPKIEIRPGSDGVLLITAGGEFDASLLLADNLWSGGQIKVDGA